MGSNPLHLTFGDAHFEHRFFVGKKWQAEIVHREKNGRQKQKLLCPCNLKFYVKCGIIKVSK